MHLKCLIDGFGPCLAMKIRGHFVRFINLIFFLVNYILLCEVPIRLLQHDAIKLLVIDVGSV